MVSVSYCCCDCCIHRNDCERKDIIKEKGLELFNALEKIDLGNGFNVYMECVDYRLDVRSTYIKIT